MIQTTKRTPLPPSVKLLRERGISFDSVNGGVQLVIRRGHRVFEFWPKSGRWRERSRNSTPGAFALHRTGVNRGEGVDSLIAMIEGDAK